jgi:hypothetical protein
MKRIIIIALGSAVAGSARGRMVGRAKVPMVFKVEGFQVQVRHGHLPPEDLCSKVERRELTTTSLPYESTIIL